jgi:hypothetical protein
MFRRDPPRLVMREQNGHNVGLASLMTGTPLPVQKPDLSRSDVCFALLCGRSFGSPF